MCERSIKPADLDRGLGVDPDAAADSPVAEARFDEACRLLLPHARRVVVASGADPLCRRASAQLRAVNAVQADATVDALAGSIHRHLPVNGQQGDDESRLSS
jgi:hypothetical protein